MGGVAVWYFTLFVAVLGGGDGIVKSRSDAFFFSNKTECMRVLDQIKANRATGDPFHSLLRHKDYTGGHSHSWNRGCSLMSVRQHSV